MTKDEALKLALEALELEDMACRYEKDLTPEHIAKAITAIREVLAEPETVSPGGGYIPPTPMAPVYGYCPECGGVGVMRERRPGGDDKCTNGHKYPSSKALAQPEYNTTSDRCLMENAQGDLERINLVQTGVGIGKLDGYRNIYSLEEKAAGCEEAVIPLYPPSPVPTSDTSEKRVDEMAKQRHEPVAKVVSTAPERIWLDLGFDPEVEDEISFDDLFEATWSHDNATGNGIEYVRADLAPASKPWVGLTDEEYSQLHDGLYQDGKSLGWVVDQVEAKLREKNAVHEEPVAWLHTKIEGVAVPHRPADLDKHPDRWTALYPESKPCPTCEALARTVMMDQTAHDAQRKPLSNQKIIEMYNEPRSDAEMIEFARAIEAAHGIWPENSDCYGPDWTDRDGEYLK